MFMLYAIAVGLAVGLITGGRAERLGRLRFRAGWLVVAAMAVQVALFSSPVGGWLDGAAAAAYVATNLVVVAVVLANVAIPGLVLVAVGAASNLAAIVANGGFMPVAASALAALDRLPADGYSNSRYVTEPALGPLTDLYAMPAGLPFANVFSIGDVLIGVGVLVAVVAAFHGRAPLHPAAESATGRTDLAERPAPG